MNRDRKEAMSTHVSPGMVSEDSLVRIKQHHRARPLPCGRASLLALIAFTALAQTPTAFQRGLAARHRGDIDAANTEFSRVVAAYERGTVRDPNQILDVAESYKFLGRIPEFKEAINDVLRHPANTSEFKVHFARIYLQTYDEEQAMKLFEEALKLKPNNPAALTGMAEIRSDTWDGSADHLTAEALEADPKYVPAMVLQARHALEDEKPDVAEKIAAKALAIEPDSLEALSMNAAAAYLRMSTGADDTEMQKRIDAVLKVNPHYGKVYADIAHIAEIHRQFSAACDFLNKAIQKDPTLWKAYADLGINYLRLGKDEAARKALETAYKGDPFNTWTHNTLVLMDSYEHYDKFETPNFRVKLDQKESAVMRPYVEELLERALATFVKEYGYKPPQKVSFEMFPDHPDFAVRTLGVPGLGALGASFGLVVAMDSPAGRKIGEFHWGSTLWHELAHVVTLGYTNNRIPRWMTEGLSVYEEWRAGWGDRIELDSISGLQNDKLMPIADLNKGYIRPTYPGQVQFAYFEGGMLVRFIVEKYGWEKVRAMMDGYKEGGENVAVIEKVLGKPTKDLDKEFQAYLNEKVGPILKAVKPAWQAPKPRAELEAEIAKNPDNFFAQIHLAHMMAKDGDKQAALEHAQASCKVFPEFTGDGNGYELAAKIYLEMDDKPAAARELQHWLASGGWNPEPAKKLAALQMELKHPEDAAKTLESFLYIAPQDPEIHNQLGAIELQLSRNDLAIREYQVALAMKPVDEAAAHFNVARAFAAAHRDADAKRETLAALEIAPGYSPAQKLLLELTDKTDKP